MIDTLCAIVEITLWELIDRTNPAQLLCLAVDRANGFGIYWFLGPEAGGQSAFLLSLSAGVHLILRFISSEEDSLSVS